MADADAQLSTIEPLPPRSRGFAPSSVATRPGGGLAMFTVESLVNMTKHKHLKLDQSKIDRAKKLLGAKTEQETIERALDLVLGEEPILKAHRRVKGIGGFEDIFR